MFRVWSGALLVVVALLVVNFHRWSEVWPLTASLAQAVPVTSLPAQGLAWGAYDPQGQLANATGLAVEQVYVPWNTKPSQITTTVRAIRARGRVPLVTLEPWPYVWTGMSRDTLLADVVTGRYDTPIEQACGALAAESPQPVLVRWGHEMDLAGRFPWATGDSQGYVAAYRHFVDTCRATGAANLSYVWSPGGDPALQDYWPGAQYVDYVGLTTLGFAQWDLQRGAERPSTFRENFDPKYALVEAYGKPVLLCEFASTGPAEYQQQWIAAAAESFGSYPLLRGVVYFDAVDPVAWGNAGIPDWRVPTGAFPPPAVASDGSAHDVRSA